MITLLKFCMWGAGCLVFLLVGLLVGCNAGLPGQARIETANEADLAGIEARLAAHVDESPEDGEAWRQLAWVQVRREKPERAEASAAAGVKALPDESGSWVALGWAQWAANYPQRAIGAFSQALQLERRHAGARLGLALSQERLGRLDAALETIKAGLLESPGNTTLRYHGARLNHRLGRDDDAAKEAGKVHLENPRHGDAAVLLADLMRRMGRFPEAAEMVEGWLSRSGVVAHPDWRIPKQLLLAIRIEQGRWAEARVLLKGLSAMSPLTPEERLAEVAVREGEGDVSGADRALEVLVRDLPGFLPARERLARRLVFRGRYREALVALQLPSGTSPDAGIQFWRAAAGFQVGEREIAEAALAGAESEAAGDPAVQLLRMGRLVALGMLGEAGERLRDFSASHPGDAHGVLLQSALAARGENPSGARAVLSEMPPNLLPGETAFARLRVDYLEGAWEKVSRGAERLREHPTLGWRADFLLGLSLFRQGQEEQALTVLLRRLKNAKELPLGRALIARWVAYLHWLGDDIRSAEKILLTELARAQDHPLLLEALSRLALVKGDFQRARELLLRGIKVAHPYRALFMDRLTLAPGKAAVFDKAAIRQFLTLSDDIPPTGSVHPVLLEKGWSVATILYGALIPDREWAWHPAVAAPPTRVPSLAARP